MEEPTGDQADDSVGDTAGEGRRTASDRGEDLAGVNRERARGGGGSEEGEGYPPAELRASHPGDASRGLEPRKVFVGGIPFGFQEEDLRAKFRRFGEIESAIVINDRGSGKSRGFGFVEFASTNGVASVLGMENSVKLVMGGRWIEVKRAREINSKISGQSSKGAVELKGIGSTGISLSKHLGEDLHRRSKYWDAELLGEGTEQSIGRISWHINQKGRAKIAKDGAKEKQVDPLRSQWEKEINYWRMANQIRKKLFENPKEKIQELRSQIDGQAEFNGKDLGEDEREAEAMADTQMRKPETGRETEVEEDELSGLGRVREMGFGRSNTDIFDHSWREDPGPSSNWVWIRKPAVIGDEAFPARPEEIRREGWRARRVQRTPQPKPLLLSFAEAAAGAMERGFRRGDRWEDGGGVGGGGGVKRRLGGASMEDFEEGGGGNRGERRDLESWKERQLRERLWLEQEDRRRLDQDRDGGYQARGGLGKARESEMRGFNYGRVELDESRFRQSSRTGSGSHGTGAGYGDRYEYFQKDADKDLGQGEEGAKPNLAVSARVK